MQCCIERDQHGRHVADGRAIGDIAADGAGGTHLARADAAQDLADIRVEPRELRLRFRIGRSGADRQPVLLVRDPVKLFDTTDQYDARQLAHLLGDPQSHVGRTCDDGRLRIAGGKIAKRVRTGRPCDEAVSRSAEQIGSVLQLRQLPGRLVRGPGPAVERRAGAGPGGRIDDGAIARAAAEIAGDLVDDVLPRRRLAGMIEREERHDESRRAEAALRTVQVDHRLLHRMQRSIFGKVVDGDELLAVDLAHQQDAGIHGFIDETPVTQTAEGHRAGATVSFVAALLGAARLLLKPEIVENACAWAARSRARPAGRGEGSVWRCARPWVSCRDRWSNRRAIAEAGRGSAGSGSRFRSGSE